MRQLLNHFRLHTRKERGPYLIHIAEGSGTDIYRLHRPYDTSLILKGLNPNASKTIIRRLRHEEKAFRKLKNKPHPNIIRVLAPMEINGERFMCMEDINGVAVYDLIYSMENHPHTHWVFPASMIRDIAMGAAQGLLHLHNQGILHGDFNATNVIIHNQDGKITTKVIDLGCSKRIGEDGRIEGFYEGNPTFSPPETDEDNVTAKADVYTLGTFIWCLFTSEFPQLDQELELPTLPTAAGKATSYIQLIEIFQKCTQRDAKRRPTMENVYQELVCARV